MFLLCLGLYILSLVHAQLFSEYNFKFKNYTAKDGLPHDKVNKVAQDSKGFLGLEMEGGLSRFDGFSFKNYQKTKTSPAL